MTHCDACGEDQVAIQLCTECANIYAEKIKNGMVMQPVYLNDGLSGKKILRPEEYRRINKESNERARQNESM